MEETKEHIPFEINETLIEGLKVMIDSKDNKAILVLLNEVHYADIAEILDDLNLDQATYVIKLLDSETTADILAELEDDVREKVLQNLSIKEIVEEVQELDSDDAADLLADLSPERKRKVIAQMDDKELVADVKELLTYNEDTAGGLMAKELVKVYETWTVAGCLRKIRTQAKNVKRVHSIYVVNKEDKLIGRLSLKDLLISNNEIKIKDIYIPKVDSVNVFEDGEEVAKIMSKYDLEAIPVVDNKKQLVGRITIDDIIDFIKEEAEEDYLLAAGVQGDVEADDSILELTKARLPWLFLGLVGGLGSVFILEGFEDVMTHPSYKTLFFFTPLIAAMAGNVGVQSSAIIVQGLANDVVKGSLVNRLLKELGLSLINGVILGILTILFGLATNLPIELSITISLSMLCVIVVAALIGTSIPILLDKKGIDPAIATGPFITTSNDIFGIFLFFYIAKIILGF